MPDLNYHTAEEFVRTIGQIQGVQILDTVGRLRIAQVPAPFFQGSELWIVNEKGFFWEPVADLDAAYAYLASDEAQEYQRS